MTRNSESPRREPTAQDLMSVLYRDYFSDKLRLFVPDRYADTEGFQKLFKHWRSFSVMCPEEQHLDAQQGSRYCSMDRGHNGAHFGDLEVTTSNEQGMGVVG